MINELTSFAHLIYYLSDFYLSTIRLELSEESNKHSKRDVGNKFNFFTRKCYAIANS